MKGKVFIVHIKPLHCRVCGDGEVLKLLLPRSVKNARFRLNDTNACVVEPTRGLAIAGVRRDIFVWSLDKQELLRKVSYL